MDDYILKILSRQRIREESAGEMLRERDRYLSREPEMETEDKALFPQEQSRERAERSENALWTMLKGMEPVAMTRYENRGSHGGNGGSVWHVPESLSRFFGTVFGQKSRQLTPEGLSMFYQRDARRFS